jgi:hypothetical protein
MNENPTVIYRARNALEADVLKKLLADEGIRALVNNDLLESGRGVDLLGWPTDAQVVVAAFDAERARQIAEQFEEEQAHLGEHALEDVPEEWSWPVCPECGSQRTATCPGCGRSGTDFAIGDRAPHAAAGGAPIQGEAVEGRTPVLLCPTCDEPFTPRYLPRCEWCGHEFEPGTPQQAAAELEADESTNVRLLAVMAAIVLLAAAVAGYVWWLFYFALGK